MEKLSITILNGKKSKGSHFIIWEGRSSKGELMPSGTYIVSLKSSQFNESKTLIIER